MFIPIYNLTQTLTHLV